MIELRSIGAVIMVVVSTAACHRDLHALTDDTVARGDQYVAGRQRAEAIIQYRRAIRTIPERADVSGIPNPA